MRWNIPIVAVLALFAAASCDQGIPTEMGEDVLASEPGSRPSEEASYSMGPMVLAVTGSGHYTNPNGALRTFSFQVRQTADGAVSGSYQLTGHQRPPARWHGRLTCLTVVGNEAWIGGFYDKSTNPALLGTGFGFYVKDNGEGHGFEPDLVRRHVRGQVPETWCATTPDVSGSEFLYPIEAGNIVVHGP